MTDPADDEPLRATAADDRARVDGLAARLRELEALVEELVTGRPPTADATGGGGAEPAADGPVHTSLAAFVTDYLQPLFTRPTLGGRWLWCPGWWEHGEAVNRLTALWHSWEALRGQGGAALGIWYRDHLDHQLPILMGADGPFRDCATGHYPTTPANAPPLPPRENPAWASARGPLESESPPGRWP